LLNGGDEIFLGTAKHFISYLIKKIFVFCGGLQIANVAEVILLRRKNKINQNKR
jgi:hypothetical protein